MLQSHSNPMGRLAHVRRHLPALLMTVLRGAALFLAVFTLIGLVGEARGRTADMSLWWIDLHDLPFGERFAFLGAVSCLLGAWAVRPIAARRRRWLTVTLVAVAAILALVSASSARFPKATRSLAVATALVAGATAYSVAEAGHYGGQLVYKHGVGINTAAGNNQSQARPNPATKTKTSDD